MGVGTTEIALNTDYSSVSSTLDFTNWWPYYPNYSYMYTYTQPPDKGRQAFQIAKALADKKLATPKTVKDFIDLVDAIFKEL